jgi:hypothetical protein
VTIEMVGIHHWCPSQRSQLEGFCNYLLRFIQPELEALLASAASVADATLIETGLERFAQLAERSDGAISLSAYQARGIKPAEIPPG